MDLGRGDSSLCKYIVCIKVNLERIEICERCTHVAMFTLVSVFLDRKLTRP